MVAVNIRPSNSLAPPEKKELARFNNIVAPPSAVPTPELRNPITTNSHLTMLASRLIPRTAVRSAFRTQSALPSIIPAARWRRTYATEAEEKDLVIIGGGVAGYVAAIKAGQEGLKVRLSHLGELILKALCSYLSLRVVGLHVGMGPSVQHLDGGILDLTLQTIYEAEASSGAYC